MRASARTSAMTSASKLCTTRVSFHSVIRAVELGLELLVLKYAIPTGNAIERPVTNRNVWHRGQWLHNA